MFQKIRSCNGKWFFQSGDVFQIIKKMQSIPSFSVFKLFILFDTSLIEISYSSIVFTALRINVA